MLELSNGTTYLRKLHMFPAQGPNVHRAVFCFLDIDLEI